LWDSGGGTGKKRLEVNIMLANKPNTRILVDGGDPNETLRVKRLIGFVDGQTTNPSLIARNPEIQRLIASGYRLSSQEEKDEYKAIVQSISPLVGNAGVSIEVFADLDTRAEEMLAQGQEMFSWIPNAYIKYPCTQEGLRAAQMSVKGSIRVNLTLCFSQDQAAAVYAATKGSMEPVYVSPFIGRLDDHGDDGMDLVRNIKKMYENGDGHVHVLAASVRNMNHLLCSFALRAELATVPTKLLEEWAATNFPMPDQDFRYTAVDASGKPLKAIAYKALDLTQPWESFDLAHELTTKGIQKFVADYRSTLRRSA
jgi:transaldolase